MFFHSCSKAAWELLCRKSGYRSTPRRLHSKKALRNPKRILNSCLLLPCGFRVHRSEILDFRGTVFSELVNTYFCGIPYIEIPRISRNIAEFRGKYCTVFRKKTATTEKLSWTWISTVHVYDHVHEHDHVTWKGTVHRKETRKRTWKWARTGTWTWM